MVTAALWVAVISLGLWLVLLYLFAALPEANVQRQQIVAYLVYAPYSGFLEVDYLNLPEKRHLLDVQRLFSVLEQGFWGLLGLALLLLFFIRRICWHCVGLIGFCLLLLPLVLMAWQGFIPLFIWLHTVFFPPNTWVFPDESLLIQFFPLAFFLRFGLVYIALLLFVFGAFVLWGRSTKPD